MERLPSETVTPRLLLRRWQLEDVAEMQNAVTASLDHLRPWMDWAQHEPLSAKDRLDLIASWDRDWQAGGDVVFGVFRQGETIGGCGLHRRGKPDTLDIGYWVHVDHVRQGYATELAAGLTTAGLKLKGIERVEIHHDKANTASEAIPRRLGFRRGEDRPAEITAPGQVGIDCTWWMARDEWSITSFT